MVVAESAVVGQQTVDPKTSREPAVLHSAQTLQWAWRGLQQRQAQPPDSAAVVAVS